MTTKLSDLQRVLLASAAARDNGSLLPLPDSIAGELTRVRKATPSLLKRALVSEADVTDPAQCWREQDGRYVGLFLSDAGREVLGVEVPDGPERPDAAAAPILAARPTKSAQVVGLLRRAQGATLAELVEATGWLPHTTRAALTGLRKKGHAIAKDKRDDVTCYHLAEVA
jgi:hypothetical protein